MGRAGRLSVHTLGTCPRCEGRNHSFLHACGLSVTESDHLSDFSVTFLTRKGCHLCDEARPVLARSIRRLGVAVNEVDIDTDDRLTAEYGLRIPVVLDPVLASARGDALGDAESVRALLAPRATVVTPNSVEARALGGPEALLALGCEYVLVTGTHEPGEDVVNTLYGKGGVLRADRWPRLPGSYHGSGCTLASAIAARLALGDDVIEAVRRAQDYTWCALERGYRPGGGQHVPDRLHAR